jgi:hypothetical protein
MKKLAMVLVATSAIGLGACTTQQGVLGGAIVGAAVGGVASNSVVGAVVGAGVGALAGAVLVEHLNNGWCTYRYHRKLYRDRCRY